MAKRTSRSLHICAAFSLAALILYFPANIFPILEADMYGAVSQNTVWEGCVRLYQDGDFVVAAIVFLASMLIPFLKLLGLFFLVTTAKLNYTGLRLPRFWVYRTIEMVGRWAMLDVFVMAVLVSLVKLGHLARVIPGPGLFTFALVVVFTVLASASFDPQLIWDRGDEAL